MGVLCALPIVWVGNMCCCLWVLSGGVVAAYLLQQDQAAPITAADGALVGLLAGLCGALIQVVVSIPIELLLGPIQRAFLQRAVDMTGNMPLEVREALERFSQSGMAGGAFFLIRIVFGLVLWLFVGAIFSTIGGLIGAVIFKKPTTPGAADVTPPTA
jgi:hypothetical protein